MCTPVKVYDPDRGFHFSSVRDIIIVDEMKQQKLDGYVWELFSGFLPDDPNSPFQICASCYLLF